MHCAKKARECAGDEVRTQAASARHVQEVEGTRKLSDTPPVPRGPSAAHHEAPQAQSCSRMGAGKCK